MDYSNNKFLYIINTALQPASTYIVKCYRWVISVEAEKREHEREDNDVTLQRA
jgi:hypothetical protein